MYEQFGMVKMEENSSKFQERNEDEMDAERIQREFQELPSQDIELLACHLARPDGFVKQLITGRLATSEEVVQSVGRDFVRTHRGHYMRMKHDRKSGVETNSYLSFKIGRVESSYSSSSPLQMMERGGLGIAVSAEDLLDKPETEIVFGALDLPEAVERIKGTSMMEPEFESITSLSEAELEKQEYAPQKEGFLTRIHLARKSGKLHAGDQAEIALHSDEDGKLPSLDLHKAIILIPASSKEAVSRLIRMKLKEISPWRDQLLQRFGMDVTSITSKEVLDQYSSIYWYPQENVDLAVQYLSTHPKKIRELLGGDRYAIEKEAA